MIDFSGEKGVGESCGERILGIYLGVLEVCFCSQCVGELARGFPGFQPVRSSLKYPYNAKKL